MKKTFKILAIIALVAAIGVGVAACDTGSNDSSSSTSGGGGKEQKFNGTVTAVESMGVRFEFNGSSSASGYDACTFTTSLDAPNNSFTLGGSSYGNDNTITSVAAGTQVTWSAVVTVVSGSTTTYEKVEPSSGLVKIQTKH